MAIQTIEGALQEWLELLSGLHAFGVDWEKSVRFRSYVEVLQRVVSLEAERSAGLPDAFREFRANPKNQGLLFEGTSQLLQLQKASQSFSRLDPKVLGRKLESVLRGEPLPGKSSSHADEPRDTLVELQAAALLEDCGSKPQITANHEDIRLELPGGHVVLVECKRPASNDSIANVVEKLRLQIWRRSEEAKSDACMAVFAIERACDMDTLGRKVRAGAEVESLVNAEVTKVAEGIDVIFRDRRMSTLVPAFLVTCSTAFFVPRPSAYLHTVTQSLPYYPEPDKAPSWLKRAFDSEYQRMG